MTDSLWRVLDEYDPDLHDDLQAPPANRALALAVTLAIIALPFIVWQVLA